MTDETTQTEKDGYYPFDLPDEELALIDSLCAQSEKREDFWIAQVFLRRGRDDQLSQTVRNGWNFVANVLQMLFRPDNAREPFGPLFVAPDGRRSITPKDLEADQIALLQSVLARCSDVEVRARVSDVLWVKLEEQNYATTAIETYLASANRLENPNEWLPCVRRLERAIRLARQLGRRKSALTATLDEVLAKLRRYRGQDTLFMTERLAALLFEFRHGPPEEIVTYVLTGAERARASYNFHIAHPYYELVEKFYRRANDWEGVRRIKTAIAETFREEAERHIASGNHLLAHVKWNSAIIAYRKVAGSGTIVAALQARLHDTAAEMVNRMKGSQHQVDLTEKVKAATSVVAGLDAMDALIRFTFAFPLIDSKKFRDETLEEIKQFPLQALMPVHTLDRRGRTVKRTPPALAGSEDEKEAAIMGRMLRNAQHRRSLIFYGFLWPALLKINEEHRFTELELAPLLVGCPLIPPNHEEYFLRGLAAGFQSDVLIALHLLVPQIENALRGILHALGTIPGSIDDDGIEEDWGLYKCLTHPQIEECLGADMVFELRTLLIEKGGPNLRNLTAHGLLDSTDCYSVESFYLWWLVLKMALSVSPAIRAHLATKHG